MHALLTNPMLPLLIALITVLAVFLVLLMRMDATPSDEAKALLDANNLWMEAHNARMAQLDAMSRALDAGDLALYRELSNTNPTTDAK